MSRNSRLAVLRQPPFRRFFVGYATSLLGSSMAALAITFAVLRTGGGGTELGWVLAARILPLVLMLLGGGVVNDRLGSRRVMPVADAVRCLSQTGLAVALLGGRGPGLGTLVALVAVWGAAEGLFSPGFGALVPRIVPDGSLADANALLGVARSAASILGPVLAGLLIALAGPSPVLGLDAFSYAVSVAALLTLPRDVRSAPPPGSTFLAELRDGWAEFRSRTWLWVTSAQMGLFNLFVWAPFLVLGPLVAQQRLGGARSWGVVMALYGAGAVAGGALMLGRVPRRPLLVGAAAGLCWGLPSAALAAGCPLPWICAAALAAGIGSAVNGTLYTTATQRQVPAAVLARVSAYTYFGAFALGPLGLAVAGPFSVLLGTSRVLAFGAAWQLAAGLVVLALPAIRVVLPPGPSGPARSDRPRGDASPAPDTSEARGRRRPWS